MKRRKPVGRQVYRSLALIMQFGINMLVPIVLMLWLGMYLDRKLGTSWLCILFFFLGAIAGFQNIYRMAKSVYAPGKTEDAPEKSVISDQRGARDRSDEED